MSQEIGRYCELQGLPEVRELTPGLDFRLPQYRREVFLCGIYAIVHKTSGKAYIGSSIRIPQRLYMHRYDLNKGEHVNPHLQAAWKKYGSIDFLFVYVEETEENLLIFREQYYIDRYSFVYNTCLAGRPPSTKGLSYKHKNSYASVDRYKASWTPRRRARQRKVISKIPAALRGGKGVPKAPWSDERKRALREDWILSRDQRIASMKGKTRCKK